MIDLREFFAQEPSRELTSDDVRRFLLEQHGVVVIHGSAYGVQAKVSCAVSFAAGGTILEQGLARLRSGLCELTAGQSPIG